MPVMEKSQHGWADLCEAVALNRMSLQLQSRREGLSRKAATQSVLNIARPSQFPLKSGLSPLYR